MPLPRVSEEAAVEVARILADLDAQVSDYVVDGGRPPTVRPWLSQLRPHVVASLTAAMRQIDPDVTQTAILEAVQAQMRQLERVIASAVREGRRARRRARRVRVEEDESAAALARRVGAVSALVALVAAARPRGRAERDRAIQRAARNVGLRLPRKTSAHGRMIVRTDTAIARNIHAVSVAIRDDKVIRVLDARKGPTDEPCEDVNGRYATPRWLAKNPVEHPNCTRLGRPVRLPAGERVTLLE